MDEKVLGAFRELVAPLIEADGGAAYVVSASAEQVHVHLTGTCAGCPGAQLTRETLVEPVVARVAPKAVVRVTTGFAPPPGATRIVPTGR